MRTVQRCPRVLEALRAKELGKSRHTSPCLFNKGYEEQHKKCRCWAAISDKLPRHSLFCDSLTHCSSSVVVLLLWYRAAALFASQAPNLFSEVPLDGGKAAAKLAQEQDQLDKHVKLAGIPRRSKEENLAYLHKEVFGHEGIQRCLIGML